MRGGVNEPVVRLLGDALSNRDLTRCRAYLRSVKLLIRQRRLRDEGARDGKDREESKSDNVPNR